MKAVLFDFYGTLTDPGVEADREAIYGRTARLLAVDPQAFWDEMSATYPVRVIGGFGGTASTFRTIAERLGTEVDDSSLSAAVQSHLSATAALRSPHPAALATLREVRARGIPVAVVSDCSSDVPETWQEGPFHPLVDATVFSSTQGYRKPDERMFLTAAELLGVKARECWFVGDGGSREHWGANRVGMRPILVTNARYPAAARHRTDADTFIPETAIDDLADFVALLPRFTRSIMPRSAPARH